MVGLQKKKSLFWLWMGFVSLSIIPITYPSTAFCSCSSYSFPTCFERKSRLKIQKQFLSIHQWRFQLFVVFHENGWAALETESHRPLVQSRRSDQTLLPSPGNRRRGSTHLALSLNHPSCFTVSVLLPKHFEETLDFKLKTSLKLLPKTFLLIFASFYKLQFHCFLINRAYILLQRD